jgi:hypothetical protein
LRTCGRKPRSPCRGLGVQQVVQAHGIATSARRGLRKVQ